MRRWAPGCRSLAEALRLLIGPQLAFHFGKQMDFGVPLPLRSSGIIDLAENLEMIYGAQAFRGKILSRRDLESIDRCLLTRLSLWR